MDGKLAPSADNIFEAFLRMNTDTREKVARQGAEIDNLKDRVDRSEQDRKEEYRDLREKVERATLQTQATGAHLETKFAEHTNKITQMITGVSLRSTPEDASSNFLANIPEPRNSITISQRELVIIITAIIMAVIGVSTFFSQNHIPMPKG